MSFRIYLVSVVFGFIWVTPCLADSLDDGAAICKQHLREPPPPPPGISVPASAQFSIPDKGWEHCPEVIRIWAERKVEADAADEAKNPDLAFTRDLARKLSK